MHDFDYYFAQLKEVFIKRYKIVTSAVSHKSIKYCKFYQFERERLRPRLHGTGSARSRYQIEYFQDECGS